MRKSAWDDFLGWVILEIGEEYKICNRLLKLGLLIEFLRVEEDGFLKSFYLKNLTVNLLESHIKSLPPLETFEEKLAKKLHDVYHKDSGCKIKDCHYKDIYFDMAKTAIEEIKKNPEVLK